MKATCGPVVALSRPGLLPAPEAHKREGQAYATLPARRCGIRARVKPVKRVTIYSPRRLRSRADPGIGMRPSATRAGDRYRHRTRRRARLAWGLELEGCLLHGLCTLRRRTPDLPAGNGVEGCRPYRGQRSVHGGSVHEEATAHHRNRFRRTTPRALRGGLRDWGRLMLPLAVALPLALLPIVTLVGALHRMATSSRSAV
jgi:hypothetical protein